MSAAAAPRSAYTMSTQLVRITIDILLLRHCPNDPRSRLRRLVTRRPAGRPRCLDTAPAWIFAHDAVDWTADSNWRTDETRKPCT
jgi:hypothetical protein